MLILKRNGGEAIVINDGESQFLIRVIEISQDSIRGSIAISRPGKTEIKNFQLTSKVTKRLLGHKVSLLETRPVKKQPGPKSWCRLGFDFPKEIRILRAELYDRNGGFFETTQDSGVVKNNSLMAKNTCASEEN